MNFQEIWDKIVAIPNTKKDFSNKNIAKALSEVGNPQYFYKTIHVGGTNGKGSTSNFIYSFLKTKFKTAIFLSPSIIDEMEMAKVNDRFILREEFTKIYLENNEIIEKNKLSFFEIKVFISLLWFKKQKVEYAVIEVGLGGLHDATNVLKPEVCIVTNIGDDHEEFLGNTFNEKAKNKLGIQQKNVKLLTSEKELFIESKYPKNIFVVEDKFHFNQYPLYQKSNYNLAIQALKFLKFDEIEIVNAIKITKLLPYRFQKIKSNVFFDGSHNIHGINAMLSSLDKSNDYVFIFSALHYKNYYEMIKKLQGNGEIYLTNFNLYDNKYSFNAHKVGLELKINYLESINDLKRDKNKIYIYCGSFYFLKSIENIV